MIAVNSLYELTPEVQGLSGWEACRHINRVLTSLAEVLKCFVLTPKSLGLHLTVFYDEYKIPAARMNVF